MYKQLQERALGHIWLLGGTLFQAKETIHLALPRVGRWIEVSQTELTSSQPDLWAAGGGPGWEAVDWPSGDRRVGQEWDVLTWVVGRLGGRAASCGVQLEKTYRRQQLHNNHYKG